MTPGLSLAMNWLNPHKMFILTTPIALNFASLAGRPAASIRMTSELNLGFLIGPVLTFDGTYSNTQATEALFNQAKELHITSTNIIRTGDVGVYAGELTQTTNLNIQYL
jgi:hypothetical protein